MTVLFLKKIHNVTYTFGDLIIAILYSRFIFYLVSFAIITGEVSSKCGHLPAGHASENFLGNNDCKYCLAYILAFNEGQLKFQNGIDISISRHTQNNCKHKIRPAITGHQK